MRLSERELLFIMYEESLKDFNAILQRIESTRDTIISTVRDLHAVAHNARRQAKVSARPAPYLEHETPETPEMRGRRLAREQQIEGEKNAAAALAAKYVSERLADEIPKYFFWTETNREAAGQFDDISQQVAQKLYEKVRRLIVGAAAAICICTLVAGWIFSK